MDTYTLELRSVVNNSKSENLRLAHFPKRTLCLLCPHDVCICISCSGSTHFLDV